MANWYPLPVCANPSCQIQTANATGAFVKFVAKCTLHSGPLFTGLTDAALYQQIQVDSMRYAHTLDAMATSFPAQGIAGLTLNLATRALLLRLIGVPPNVLSIQSAIQSAIVNSPVLKVVLATAVIPAATVNLTIQTGA